MRKDEMFDHLAFVPYLLDAIASRLGTNAARIYQTEFGLGLGEWRVLSMLAVEPGATVARISELAGIDQGAVSRSLFSLSERKLIDVMVDPSDRRRRIVTFTEAGQRMYEEVLARARSEETKLLRGLDPHEREVLVSALRKLHGRLFAKLGR